MCSLFSSLGLRDFAFQTRSVRLSGHATSIRLEAAFWAMLENIAQAQDVPMGRFLSGLHDESLKAQSAQRPDAQQNFASMLRCACLAYALDAEGQAGDALRLRQADAGAHPAKGRGSSVARKTVPRT